MARGIQRGEVHVGITHAPQQFGADRAFVLQARHVQQRDAQAFRRDVARGARAAVHVVVRGAQRAVQRDEGADAVVAGRGQHACEAAPAVADDGDAVRVRLRQRLRVADEEADVAGLRLGAFQVGRHRMRARAQRRRRDHDVAVAREVFAQVGVLDGIGAVARRIDHDGEFTRTFGRVAQGTHGAGQVALDLRRPRVDERVGGAAHLVRHAAEFLFRRHGRHVVAVGQRAARADGRIPDQRLQRTRTVAARRLCRDGIARMLVDARPVVLLADVESDAVRAGRGGRREVGGRRGVREGEGEQQGGQGPEHRSSAGVSLVARLYAEPA